MEDEYGKAITKNYWGGFGIIECNQKLQGHRSTFEKPSELHVLLSDCPIRMSIVSAHCYTNHWTRSQVRLGPDIWHVNVKKWSE